MNIVKNRKKFIGLSITIMLIGFIMYVVNGFNYGIDFTGGTIIEIEAGKEIPVEKAEKIVKEYDKDISIIHAGNNKEILIIKSTLDLSNEDVMKITEGFKDKFGINEDKVFSEKIGPSMGVEIRNKALLSILVATIAMLVYITFRFEFNYGLAAITALLHDVLITISIYTIFKLPVNSSFIAAILTIVGYSINDTIVIFDRMREEKRLNRRATSEEVVNLSVKYSMRRTINTSITTIVSVLILYIVGVEDIKVLAFPLMLGMLAGTYSSIFIAPNIWYNLNNREKKTA